MKTPIEFVTSEITITTGQNRAQTGMTDAARKPGKIWLLGPLHFGVALLLWRKLG